MKQKLFFLDLVILSVWMLCLFGGRNSWAQPNLIISMVMIILRLTITFSLYHREKRAWLPLAIFIPFVALAIIVKCSIGIGEIVYKISDITKYDYNMTIRRVIGVSLLLWIFIMPYVTYFILLLRKQLVRTELTLKELVGGIFWHSRFEKTCSALLMVMLVTFMTGLAMDAHLCLMTCLTAAPLSYWLLCHYYRFNAEKLYVLVVGMVIFWHAQMVVEVWRVLMLTMCFVMALYVGWKFYENTKKSFATVVAVLYLGILLPSFAIGYNQYTCLEYARSGFYYLSPYKGIIYITDSTRKLYGLRDRYGLLVEPEYEHIRISGHFQDGGTYIYEFRKDGYSRYYDVVNNTFMHEPDINPELQRKTRLLIENHFDMYGSDLDDRGQITVTDIGNHKIVANVMVSMYGNPILCYDSKNFIPADSVQLASGTFLKNDSANVIGSKKHSLSYVLNVPNDDAARYRVYVCLITDKTPSNTAVRNLAEFIASLPELK